MELSDPPPPPILSLHPQLDPGQLLSESHMVQIEWNASYCTVRYTQKPSSLYTTSPSDYLKWASLVTKVARNWLLLSLFSNISVCLHVEIKTYSAEGSVHNYLYNARQRRKRISVWFAPIVGLQSVSHSALQSFHTITCDSSAASPHRLTDHKYVPRKNKKVVHRQGGGELCTYNVFLGSGFEKFKGRKAAVI